MYARKMTAFAVFAALAASAILPTAAQAQAQAQAQPQAQTQGKTRDQVKQELVAAHHEGVLPISDIKYPGTPETIARNKQIHNAARHPGETDPAIDHHDNPQTK
jgi:hypothetical protein